MVIWLYEKYVMYSHLDMKFSVCVRSVNITYLSCIKLLGLKMSPLLPLPLFYEGSL